MDDVLKVEHAPPRTRPIFRYLAGTTAVLLAIISTGIWFGVHEPDAWKVVMGTLGLGVLMAVIAIRGS